VYVVATAGHVDHGKSTLVRALTGTDPDRLEEERRRGLTIALGYCWTDLPGVGEVAFVDVPGHERFISTMLAGVGPVPAVLFVVAADDDWMPQAAEHLAALDAFGVEHAVVAVTRADLADPLPAMERAAAELGRTSMRGAPVIPVSGATGDGLPELRAALASMTATLAAPAPDSDVRLWVDRRFTISGAGTVVTGTLPAGTIAVGDRLAAGEELVRVRGIEALGQPREQVAGVARVALSLGSKVPDALRRDSVLVSPDAWHWTTTVDVILHPAHAPAGFLSAGPTGSGPATPGRAGLVLHVGAVAETVHFRPLGETHGRVLLGRPLPLRVGDRAILRDPGSRRLWGITVVDPVPPPLVRRGSAARRAADLKDTDGTPDAAAEVRRRGIVRASLLRHIGVNPNTPDAASTADAGNTGGAASTGDTGNTGDVAGTGDAGNTGDVAGTGDAGNTGNAAGTSDTGNTGDAAGAGDTGNPPDAAGTGDAASTGDTAGDAGGVVRAGDWLVGADQAVSLRARLAEAVRAHGERHPLDPGLPVRAAAVALGLPSAQIVAALVSDPLRLSAGQIFPAADAGLPAELLDAIAEIVQELRDHPFKAPEADRLRAAGLDRKSLAAAERAGLLMRLTENVVLLPGAEEDAARRLTELPQPFTTGDARRRLDSSRRVVIPLLERLDHLGLTHRLPDDRRHVRPK
jgi:selenocysteine-specific elongation factor